MKKIIIFGFPHCGTTILRSIIGHIDNVYEHPFETNKITDEIIKEAYSRIDIVDAIIIKDPFIRDYYFTSDYDDYIKIFLIRNPYHVFSSLNKRFKSYKIPSNHSINEWEKVACKFISMRDRIIKSRDYDNFYCIRYEDLFKNNFKSICNILDNIGLRYDYTIFNNIDRDNRAGHFEIRYIRGKPPNKNHDSYRTWQINQPFQNMNTPDKIDLTDIQIKTLESSIIAKKLKYFILLDITSNRSS
jgi:hypothetical protein